MSDITIKKVPGAAEDLLLDASLPSKVNQVRFNEIVEVTKINASTIPYNGTPGETDFLSIRDKLGTAGQYVGDPDIDGPKAIGYLAKATDENLVVTSDMNAFSINSIVIEDGGSITLENDAIYKVL